jgi:hypothetical protein
VTPGQRRFSRRAVLVGTAGVAGALVAGESILRGDGQADHGTAAPTDPSDTSHVEETGQTVDLTVRWRHLKRRVSNPELLAGWQFDEGSGYAFDDVSGHGHTLHVTGRNWNTTDSGLASALHRRGLRGGAAYVDGNRWLAAAPTVDLAPRTGLTVSCWVWPDVLPQSSVALVGLGETYALLLNAAGGVTFKAADRSGTQRVVDSPPRAVTAGRWSHVSASVDPRTGVLRLYVDGDLVSRAQGQPFGLQLKVASLVVGDRLQGAFDELAIHRVALSAGRVRELYLLGLPKVFTQTSESIDAQRRIFTRFKGSDPVPHPVDAETVLTHRFAASTRTEQGVYPTGSPTGATFVPGAFGAAWRATSHPLTYPSPVPGDSGTFEAWYRAIEDPHDRERLARKSLFTAAGVGCALTLYTESGRWLVEVRRRGGRTDTVAGPPHPFIAGNLEHVAVSWGLHAGGRSAVTLYVNGTPTAFLPTGAGETSYGSRITLGGDATAPTFAIFEDVRISSTALPWGAICPRGQVATDAAGLDLRDRFDRPPGAAPMLWRAGSGPGRWSHRLKTWERPGAVGADPDSRRALYQGQKTGLRAVFHPDAYGHASSIEAGVAFPEMVDGWAGLFVHAGQPDEAFSGVTLMLNPHRGEVRIARIESGRVTTSKVLRDDFAIRAQTTYEMTLTAAGDGVVRGFLDGSNVISMSVGVTWPDRGYAGMLTEDAQAFFSDLHFCALTPASPASRVIRTSVMRYGDGAAVVALGLIPFRWHKRRGLLPWQYTFKDPEPAGNLAGADTSLPLRPIGSATWRSEDSANSDLVIVGGRVLYFMRGNPRIDNRASAARVGVLHVDVPDFDGVHFTDPNENSPTVTGGTVLASGGPRTTHAPVAPGSLQLNEPSTAYVGDGRLLFLGRESSVPKPGDVRYGRLVFSRFDVRTDSWEHSAPQHMPWSQLGPLSRATPPVPARLLHGTPEVVSLRRPDDDSYQAVVFQQTGSPGDSVMATALLDEVSAGVPALAPGAPIRTSLSRISGGAIYGFRVMFDNGIYYLHYNEGVQVPDWPERFVLAATLDPYAGPWVENAETLLPTSTYFRRGDPFEPDNAAIWQGCMFKHRGSYYLYYENFHAVDDVNQPYASYANPQAGSRVGLATA